MPIIQRINAEPYNIPLKNTLKWGRDHQLKHLDHALIRVELSDGSVSIAEATPRPTIYGETQASVIHIIEQYLAPMLIGKTISDFDSIANLSHRVELIKSNNTAKGALDMALHHALAQSQSKALSDYLRTSQHRIQVSYIVSTGNPNDVFRDIESAYGAGVRVFKVKIGKDIPQEVDTLRQLIENYQDADFYVDANQTLTIDNAPQILNTLYELGVIHCEEPLPIHQLKQRQHLCEKTEMPLIADDSAFTLNDLHRELDFNTFDILNIKTPRTGFSQSEAMLKLCSKQGKSVMMGSQASSLLGCLYAATFAGKSGVDCASECTFFLKTDVDLSDAPKIIDGYLAMEDVQISIAKVWNRLQ